MRWIALAAAVALLSATAFAVGQTPSFPPDVPGVQGTPVAKGTALIDPLPNVTNKELPPPHNPEKDVPPPNSDKDSATPNPYKLTPPTPWDSLPPAPPPPANPPSTKPPPLLSEAMTEPMNGFSALPISPAGYRFWAGEESLLWWEKKGQLPANLVTTGLLTDAAAGALGQPNTLGLSGPGNLNFKPFVGLRLFAGAWFDPQQILGVEASGFVLQQQGQSFAFNSTIGGNPLLALRHFDPASEAQNAFVIAAPLARSGAIALQTTTQLWGADANLAHTFFWSNNIRLVGLFGFRYLDLNEGLSIQTRSMAIDGSSLMLLDHNFAAPAYALTADQFHARSQFFGGQVGARFEYYFSHFYVAAISKLAVGQTDEVVNALGASTLQIGSTPVQKTAGGLYALPSNSGRFVNPDLGIVPELQLKAGVLLMRWLRVTIGYDALYWSRVLRVGNAFDLTVDARQVPTSSSFQPGIAAHSPQPAFHTSSFWAQGLTLGVEFTY